MRVISMVPSWTETLLEAGVEVVGRTRFCVHPAEKVSAIPIVGGTKNVDWGKVRALNADLLVLDREENPKSFAEESPLPWVATHVTDLPGMAAGLEMLAARLHSATLAGYGDRCRLLWHGGGGPPRQAPDAGVLSRWGEWSAESNEVIYLIWRKPWMLANRGTFIASVLEQVGYRLREIPAAGLYPEAPEELVTSSVCLFSSEPFPFGRQVEELKKLCPRGALVDGECFSWFGLRALRFLEKQRVPGKPGTL
ncbi:MAG: Fe3+-siderophores ABC transporter protein [Bdellovibrionaceae bacterium]|nr:Fe3+-siderophores ABC transporter protein [Pseudobdellovibrionaceae bacterium]